MIIANCVRDLLQDGYVPNNQEFEYLHKTFNLSESTDYWIGTKTYYYAQLAVNKFFRYSTEYVNPEFINRHLDCLFQYDLLKLNPVFDMILLEMPELADVETGEIMLIPI